MNSLVQDYTNFEDIGTWLKTHGVTDYIIHDNLVVDIASSLDLANQKITHLPFQFGRVESDCFLNGNHLTTLKNAPYEVKGSFFCSKNRLTTLEGSPHTVGITFDCSENNLTTLKGSPEKLGSGFDCSYNQLTTLQGGPEIVPGWFFCNSNKLISLKYAPCKVGINIEAHDNPIKSLKDFTGIIQGGLFLTGFDLTKENILQWKFDCMKLVIKNSVTRLKLLEKYYFVIQNPSPHLELLKKYYDTDVKKTVTLSIQLKVLKTILLENKLQTELKPHDSIIARRKI